MTDPFRKVQPGQSLNITASAYNAFVDAAAAHRHSQANRHGGTSGISDNKQTGIVLIANQSGEDLNRFGVLGINGVLITPTDNEQAFKNQVVLTGTIPSVTSHFGRFAVLLEPIASGKIGRACVSGVCPAKIQFIDNDDVWRADVTDGSTTCLSANATGAAVILWTDSMGGGSGDDIRWAVIKIGNPAIDEFAAVITGSQAHTADKQWKYEWAEVTFTSTSYMIMEGGRSGTFADDGESFALNINEMGHVGNVLAGVDTAGADYPNEFHLKPIGGGGTDDSHKYDTVVWMKGYPTQLGGSGSGAAELNMRYYFYAMNSHDGVCGEGSGA